MRILIQSIILVLLVNLCVTIPTINAQDCVIPASGPWPSCATGGVNPSPPKSESCVIPVAGPWPSCATGGTNPPAPSPPQQQNDDCVIPPSGAWPSCATNGRGNAPQPSAPPATSVTNEQGRVTRVIDGDTFEVEINGRTERVRLLGIDSTERGQRCYSEGGNALRSMIDGKWVSLKKDVSERDRYNRLLRYVYNGSQFVNREMVKLGMAYATPHAPDVKYATEFDSWERRARDNWVGCLWQNGTPAPDCHPSYPDVCIPSPPPDLDCPDIPHKNIRVVGSDPHGLDGDNDGIGCES